MLARASSAAVSSDSLWRAVLASTPPYNSDGHLNLGGQAMMWSTVMASEMLRNQRGELLLESEARIVSEIMGDLFKGRVGKVFPTLQASATKRGSRPFQKMVPNPWITLEDVASELSQALIQLGSRLDQKASSAGSRFFARVRISGLLLNPKFCEGLMGLPEGWISRGANDYGSSETP